MSNLDEDVVGERQRVENLMRDWHQKSDVLLVHNLFKQFGNRGLIAVNNLSFGVKNGECFGLLGVNGAGKTTSFRYVVDPSSFLGPFLCMTRFNSAS